MALAEGTDAKEVSELAKDLASWLDSAAALPELPTKLLVVQVRQVLKGLEQGRSPEKAYQRLSQTMAETVQQMGKILASSKSAKGPKGPEPGAVGEEAGGLFVIPADDISSFQSLVEEAPGHLQDIESGLLALTQGEVWDPMRVLRPFHTLKGICGFMGLKDMAHLAHQSEAMLERYKDGKNKPLDREVDLLLGSADIFKAQIELIESGLGAGKFPLVDVRDLLARMAGGVQPGALTPAARAASTKTGEDSPTHSDRFLRIAVEKMDLLLETVGELAICQTQVTEGIQLSGTLGHLASEANRLGKISRQLQELVLSLRMVPVHPLFQRMSRLARDLSQKTGKPLLVELEGGETELDKRMTEELVDPLVHLVRNAVDHGIESPEARAKTGKPAEARLSMRASHQGGDFILRVEDDGAGLPFEKLRQKGAALGHLAQGEITHERLTELIFMPGFSTAEKVTEVSGRGVGLDAVKRKITALKGSIQVESREGQGTTFVFRIPLTMALIDGIVVRVADARYILPSFHVRQFMAFQGTENHKVSRMRGWLDTPFGQLPLLELSEWFGSQASMEGRPVVIHVNVGDRDACLVVDEVVGKQQVVVKGLGEHLAGLPGVAGGAILGDGQVGFILDIGAMVQGGERPVLGVSGN
jgi:two-component system chemotaxis sensor kinase CheA